MRQGDSGQTSLGLKRIYPLFSQEAFLFSIFRVPFVLWALSERRGTDELGELGIEESI